MKILIVSKKPELFEELYQSLDIQIFDGEDWNQLSGDYRIGYIDQQLRDCRNNCRERLMDLQKDLDIPWGVLDFTRKIKDPMQLILHGWADYICGKDLVSKMDEARLQDILYFFENKHPIPSRKKHILEGKPSGDTWDNINEDEEYIFGMLYTQAVPTADLEAQLGERGIEQLQREWYQLLQNTFDPWYGYHWISNGWSSIMLFPFNGKKLHAIEGALEFYLNSPIYRYPSYKGSLQYKQVIHLASTTFKKRNHTSQIVSESINDLFHMGLYHAQPGRLYITDPAMIYLPESMDNHLDDVTNFEGHQIHRFKNPF